MKRLSQITESIWSDIQDRSSGEIIRKEDDINLLDVDGFFEYLENLDSVKVYLDSNKKDFISIDDIILSATKRKKLFLVMEYSSGVADLITLPYSFSKDYENVYNKMFDEYSLYIPEFSTPDEEDDALNTGFIEIAPKDGSPVTNKFFLEVLNFILINCGLSGINESVWADLQDRSSGEIIRKEDDINNLDRDGLYEYIFDLYEQIDPFPRPLKSQTSQTYTYFSIPIFKSNYKVYRLDCTFDNSKISKITLMANDTDVKDFKQALIDNFDCTIRHDGALKITAKDGTVSNQVCMDLIKVIVENAPEPYLKKRGQ